MAPAQLLRQRGNNRLVGKMIHQLNHSRQIGPIKPSSILGGQLLRQRGNNLLPVLSPLFVQHVITNSLADSPIQLDQGRVHGPRRILPRPFD